VPPDDEDALAATLDDLARNPGRRARLAAAARDRALTFSPARMSARYLALYRAMLDERAGANALESPCA
jgi:glycosyltransferase involved in cell wall biosynthesis